MSAARGSLGRRGRYGCSRAHGWSASCYYSKPPRGRRMEQRVRVDMQVDAASFRDGHLPPRRPAAERNLFFRSPPLRAPRRCRPAAARRRALRGALHGMAWRCIAWHCIAYCIAPRAVQRWSRSEVVCSGTLPRRATDTQSRTPVGRLAGGGAARRGARWGGRRSARRQQRLPATRPMVERPPQGLSGARSLLFVRCLAGGALRQPLAPRRAWPASPRRRAAQACGACAKPCVGPATSAACASCVGASCAWLALHIPGHLLRPLGPRGEHLAGLRKGTRCKGRMGWVGGAPSWHGYAVPAHELRLASAEPSATSHALRLAP
eukprot:scaffold2727_cov385-Prasinococcus_capsulatus_cf.AAC.6